jgi:hypothetical protein
MNHGTRNFDLQKNSQAAHKRYSAIPLTLLVLFRH